VVLLIRGQIGPAKSMATAPAKMHCCLSDLLTCLSMMGKAADHRNDRTKAL
jgi:hypothetical protein